MVNETPRPVILLYTEAAEITEDVRAAMIEAGYLPVRVADVGAVRILEAPAVLPPGDIPAITRAALEAIVNSGYDPPKKLFGQGLAKALLAAEAQPTH